MQDQIEHVVYDLLKMLHLPVSKTFLKSRLASHPDQYSLLSITDTLDDLGIPYGAVRIEKDQLPEIDPPFLAHIRSNNGRFILIKNSENIDNSHPGFSDAWDGVILMVDSTAHIRHKENTKMLRQERLNKGLIGALILSGLFLIGYPLLNEFSAANLFFLGLALAGSLLSVLILQKEAGINNPLIDQFCDSEKTTDCNTVLNSKASTLFARLKLSDIGMIYFSSQLIILLFSIFSRSPLQVKSCFAAIAACTLPFTLFSLYYQGLVLKKWCPLCLSVLLVLWLQFLVLLPNLAKSTLTAIEPATIGLLLAALVFTGTSWLLLRQLIFGKTELENDLLRTRRLKQDPKIFAFLMQDQRQVMDVPSDPEIQLGTPGKNVRLLAVLNPYCKPCANTWRQLEELLDNSADWFSLTIRFTLNTGREDKRTEAVRYLLQYWKTNEAQMTKEGTPVAPRKLLQSWFSHMNLTAFKKSHPLNSFPDVEPLLKEYDGWAVDNGITATPSIFLNGYEWPHQYSVKDLNLLRPSIEEFFSNHVSAGNEDRNEVSSVIIHT